MEKKVEMELLLSEIAEIAAPAIKEEREQWFKDLQELLDRWTNDARAIKGNKPAQSQQIVGCVNELYGVMQRHGYK